MTLTSRKFSVYYDRPNKINTNLHIHPVVCSRGAGSNISALSIYLLRRNSASCWSFIKTNTLTWPKKMCFLVSFDLFIPRSTMYSALLVFFCIAYASEDGDHTKMIRPFKFQHARGSVIVIPLVLDFKHPVHTLLNVAAFANCFTIFKVFNPRAGKKRLSCGGLSTSS